jgi:hypothetical protein
MFSGYLYHHSPPLAAFAILTNFQSFKSETDGSVVWDHFECTYWSENRPIDGEMSLVQRVGFYPAMNNQDVTTLRALLVERKPAQAILGKAIEVLHAIAQRPQAHGAIGKQLSSIIVPRDKSLKATSNYHSNVVTHEVYIPDMVVVISPHERTIVTRASIKPVDPDNTAPMAVPKSAEMRPVRAKVERSTKDATD